MAKVERMKLGSQGLEISAQGLGCAGMSRFGQHKTEEEIIKLIHHAVDSGVTFLDTADVYGPDTGESSLASFLIWHLLRPSSGDFSNSLPLSGDIYYLLGDCRSATSCLPLSLSHSSISSVIDPNERSL